MEMLAYIARLVRCNILAHSLPSAAGLKRYRRAGRWVPSIFFAPVSCRMAVAKIFLRKLRLSNLCYLSILYPEFVAFHIILHYTEFSHCLILLQGNTARIQRIRGIALPWLL